MDKNFIEITRIDGINMVISKESISFFEPWKDGLGNTVGIRILLKEKLQDKNVVIIASNDYYNTKSLLTE